MERMAENQLSKESDGVQQVVAGGGASAPTVSDTSMTDIQQQQQQQEQLSAGGQVSSETVVDEERIKRLRLIQRVRTQRSSQCPCAFCEHETRVEYLCCSSQHKICLTRGRLLVADSTVSPSGLKYDCPSCKIGCVIDLHQQAMALIKDTWDWRLSRRDSEGQMVVVEGTKPGFGF
jgi:hypothetical protein